MNIKKVIKYSLVIAVPSLLLAKCSMKEIINVLPPSLNFHPKEKLRIYGNFPFKDDVEFGLQATYIATNSICDSVSIDITRKAEREIEIKPVWKGNDFEAEVYHDYLSSGICGWKLGAVSYTMKSKPDGIVVSNEWEFNGKRMAQVDTFGCISDEAVVHQDIPVECKKLSGYCDDLEPKKMQKECIDCRHIDDESIRYVDNERFHASYSYDTTWCTAIPKTQKAIQLHFTNKGWEK
ncbi:MAG: hypothetical protein NTY39_12640 [Campylobacterales bacterium]|nr:hypothetical protein [Campylobacterales bacterium]